jgi:hypothetical protein
MATARVVVQKLNKKPLEVEIREMLIPLADRQLFVLSKETVKEIRERIKNNILRDGSTGHLASSFFEEKTEDGYGIGNINYLNQNCKYWAWQNYGIAQSGRTIPPITIGRFEGIPEYPMSGSLRDQRWIHESGEEGGYLMIPAKPITAKNFIEQTMMRIPEMINRVLNTVK